jgi:hypothetical protein
MKDDYLWNGTGDDIEIKRLEAALSVFRQEADATAPVLPAHGAAPNAKRWSWMPWLGFAFAPVAGAVLIATVWLSIGRTEVLETTAIFENRVPVDTQGAQHAKTIEDPVVGNPTSQAVPTHPLARPRYNRGTRVRREPQVNRSTTTVRRPSPVLTSEEKYAYEQLKLALSITSSKFKIVRDTINGTAGEKGLDLSDKR